MIVNKICPDCEAEYYSHIEKCADCGTVLLLREEHRRAQETKKRLALKVIERGVVVRLIYAHILHRHLGAANPRGRDQMTPQGNEEYFIGRFGDERLKKTALYFIV